MKGLNVIIMLMCLLMIPFKSKSTKNSTFHPHALQTDSLSFQQVKALIPKGYILFTTSGAKEALKAKIDAISYKNQSIQKDSVIVNQAVSIDNYKSAYQQKDAENLALRKKNFWINVEKWGLRISVIFLGGKQLKAW